VSPRTSKAVAETQEPKFEKETNWEDLTEEERNKVYEEQEKEKEANRPSGSVEVPKELGNDWGYFSDSKIVRGKYSVEDDAYIVFDEVAYQQEVADAEDPDSVTPEGEWVAPDDFNAKYMTVPPAKQPSGGASAA